jgi:zinc protease
MATAPGAVGQQTATKQAPAATKQAQKAPVAHAFDCTKIPPEGPTPVLRVPAWSKTALANGAEVIVSEKHDLPLVSFSRTFLGGAAQFEPASRRGLAGIAAAMLSEGTKTRNGGALSNAMQTLGTTIGASIGSESGSIAFTCTSAKLAAALDLMGDMLLNSTFPADALDRIRAQRLVALTQAKAQPRSVADRVFPRVVYGTSHP